VGGIMKKITEDNKTYIIDCEDNMCGNCNFKPTPDEGICNLFKIAPDHVRSSLSKDSGWQRLSKCKNAEVKEN
jgi:hypothetical protein